MNDKAITEAEAEGASALKWSAAERGDIDEALEMQRIECQALVRLAKQEYDNEGENWKR